MDKAREQGAKILTGGRAATSEDTNGQHGTGTTDLGAGVYYLPTIIDGATREMDCVHDEAFGPTVTIGPSPPRRRPSDRQRHRVRPGRRRLHF